MGKARIQRRAVVPRKTKETNIRVEINLDAPITSGSGIQTTVPFMDHMLGLFGAHSGFGFAVRAAGDTQVDDHHVVEDLGISLGQAVKSALAGGPSFRRYGSCAMPMDEALVQVTIDLSGRAHLSYGLDLGKAAIKSFDAALVEEFFLGFVRNVPCTLHLRKMDGRNVHHIVEAAFKGFGRALADAVSPDRRFRGIPSTKGRL